ncbi:MAG: sigma 54-interacting transcriptional regulator [Clostridia bacterium]|nr:sigma 54-interacting transcriptional regulator [Clostridia bacterium]
MSRLAQISESVQQVAEAIALAVGVEIEIVDKDLTIIGGTGAYSRRIGAKEEFGKLNGNFLYARVMRSGVTEFVEDALTDENYGTSSVQGEITELAEVCTPIKIDNVVIGIIGLIAFDEKQKKFLVNKKKSMISFVEKMADFLAVKAVQNEMYDQLKISKEEIDTILETVHESIIGLDKQGYINHCNSAAETLLKTPRDEILKKHISVFMPGATALDVLKTGKGYTENEEIYSTSKGKFHFIVTVKPIINITQISGAVISFRDIEEAQKLVYNMSQRTLKYTFDDIIGESEEIRKIKNQALLISRGSSTVLITGESGTGKEMFAKAVHYASSRAKAPFVTVNCGAIPENLLESELFGYEKGAFTGANEKGKIGKFELANGGTIFLDEIGDMPIHLQVKLLHVLQNMRFERVGGNRTVMVDVRVVAATNRDLEEMITEGKFREDLYYRLSVIPLMIPPLRERKDDILLLMQHFLKKYNIFMNKDITDFSDEVKKIYLNYEWNGNVRELENAVEYGVNMTFGNKIGLDAVPLRLTRHDHSTTTIIDNGLPLNEQVRLFEREILMKKLKEYGNTQKAKLKIADDLGVSRATLYRKLSELELS